MCQKHSGTTMPMKHGRSYIQINIPHMKYVTGLLNHALVYEEAHLQTW